MTTAFSNWRARRAEAAVESDEDLAAKKRKSGWEAWKKKGGGKGSSSSSKASSSSKSIEEHFGGRANEYVGDTDYSYGPVVGHKKTVPIYDPDNDPIGWVERSDDGKYVTSDDATFDDPDDAVMDVIRQDEKRPRPS